MNEEKNCWDCKDRIGGVCMKHAVLLKYPNGLGVGEYDKEYLQKICWCKTGKNGTQYELKNKKRR